MPDTKRPLASIDEVSQYLGIPIATIYGWRLRGLGPPAAKVGRHLRFRWSDVEAWVDHKADATTRAGG